MTPSLEKGCVQLLAQLTHVAGARGREKKETRCGHGTLAWCVWSLITLITLPARHVHVRQYGRVACVHACPRSHILRCVAQVLISLKPIFWVSTAGIRQVLRAMVRSLQAPRACLGPTRRGLQLLLDCLGA